MPPFGPVSSQGRANGRCPAEPFDAARLRPVQSTSPSSSAWQLCRLHWPSVMPTRPSGPRR